MSGDKKHASAKAEVTVKLDPAFLERIDRLPYKTRFCPKSRPEIIQYVLAMGLHRIEGEIEQEKQEAQRNARRTA